MDLATDDEQRLWVASVSGDGRAFAQIFSRHRDRVFRRAAGMLESDSDADDVVAAAFFELWRRRSSVRIVDGSVLPWLLVTAANLARNHHRGVRRYRAVLDRLPRSAAPTAEHVGLATTPVGRAMRSLDRVDAALVVLTVFEGYPVAAAALALGLKEPTARSRLFRARKRLREQVAPGDDAIREPR